MGIVERKIKEFLKSRNIPFQNYTLINNFGFKFEFKGKKFDARFWNNLYGAYVGKWSLNNSFLDERQFQHGDKITNFYIEKLINTK